MRAAILVAMSIGILTPPMGIEQARLLAADRKANGESSPNEQPFRLPRRDCRTKFSRRHGFR